MSISPRLSRRRRVFLGTMANVRGGRFLAGGRRKEPRHKMFRADARRALLESIERKEKERKEKAWRIMETCIPCLRNMENFRSTREHPHCWGMNGRNFPQFPPSWSGFHGQTPPRWIVFRSLAALTAFRCLPLFLLSPLFLFPPLLSSLFLRRHSFREFLLPRIEESSRDDADREVLLLDAGENFEEGCESKRLCITVCFFWKEKKKGRRRNSVVRIVV